VLRHTIACRLVQSGASFKVIADLLRHRSLDTTMIYAKVDLEGLKEVAAPWPGRRP
jgi:site-specific recombinase XerD